MSQMYQILLGLFVLGVLVVIHELGHFLLAKLFGVRVLSFSIGFGKPLIRWTKGDTEYRISAIPFGGYVHMAGEHPEDDQTAQPWEFGAKPIWQRACIAVAGPLFNYGSAIAFLWITFVVGVPRPLYLDNTTIGAVAPGSPAESATLMAGDRILTIDNLAVTNWEDIDKGFGKLNDTVTIGVARADSVFTAVLTGTLPKGSEIAQYGAGGLFPAAPAVAGPVQENEPAARAGILQGDSILSINGSPVHSWQEMSQMVADYDSTQAPLSVGIVRNGVPLELIVQPRFNSDAERYLMGVRMAEPPSITRKSGPIAAVAQAFDRAWELVILTFDNLGKIISAKISPRQLAGPIGIVQMSGGVALMGIVPGLNFMALISINLALLNLLPFLIITDGGLLFFMVIEAIRRKPLALKYQMIINRVALSLIIAIFLFVTFNDLGRIPALFRLTGH